MILVIKNTINVPICVTVFNLQISFKSPSSDDGNCKIKEESIAPNKRKLVKKNKFEDNFKKAKRDIENYEIKQVSSNDNTDDASFELSPLPILPYGEKEKQVEKIAKKKSEKSLPSSEASWSSLSSVLNHQLSVSLN